LTLFDGIEKFITEHGSAAIIGQQLSFAKDQFVALERKVSELHTQNGKLEAKLEREQLDHDKAKQELKRLQKEHEEETIIHRTIEFHKGKRTGNKWLPFCPNCHRPATELLDKGEHLAVCSMRCGWTARLPSNLDMAIHEAGKIYINQS